MLNERATGLFLLLPFNRDVSDLTGFPEMLGGRVKTLHPAVHAGKADAVTESQCVRQTMALLGHLHCIWKLCAVCIAFGLQII